MTRHVVSDPGKWYPLGATCQPGGVNFALHSEHATGVVLLLFDAADAPASHEIRLENRTRLVWHGFVAGLRPGQLYGYRVEGPYQPERGLRFNPNKVLIDPQARALHGRCRNVDNILLGYDAGGGAGDLGFDSRDDAAFVPKAVVVDEHDFDWAGDQPPALRLRETVVYEVHLKGFTAHPSSGVAQPGTYLGFIEKIPHLLALGVNAVELLPVHAHLDESFLAERGLSNYWGYNTLGYFAPEPSYGSGREPACEVREFKMLVRELHRAGIEVILDVVFNHTAEGNEWGPTLSLRGIDNPSYYMLEGPADQPGRHHVDLSGCGNTLDPGQPATIRLIMDALRYWVEVMHVDGFRFDLASVLGHDGGRFTRRGALFDAIAQDPVLHRAKLIAEPWDLGGYEAGNFPVDWSEWNGRFRDTARRFVKGDPGQLADLGWRLSGSADLYGDDGRSPYNSINFVTCHDGFTLADLVSYDAKHNDANGEGNRDGSNANDSWNSGVEGPSDDPAVLSLRRRLAKNHFCLLLLAAGTPMICGGDEFLRSQHGNNNAYCQDNPISWFDWDRAAHETGMQRFVARLIAFTRRCNVVQRRKHRHLHRGARQPWRAITWYGTDLEAPRWNDAQARTVCIELDSGTASLGPGPHRGTYSLLMIFHAGHTLQPVRLPVPAGQRRWFRVADTSLPDGDDIAEPHQEMLLEPADAYLVNPRSTVVLLAREPSVRGAPAFVAGRQVSQLTVIGRDGRNRRVVYETPTHIEAPNWTPDGAWLVFNSGGRLYRIAADGSGVPQPIDTDPALDANNDHILSPDGRTIYFSENAGGLYAVPWQGGAARRVSNTHPADRPLRYYLHGISPDGATLVHVGIGGSAGPGAYGIYSIAAAGGPDVTLLQWGVPVDGPEYSPDARWIYFNGEDPAGLPGHAQICRMRPDGSAAERLTHDERVNWFPHPSPDGRRVAFLSYPPGTRGHPANREVVIRMMRPDGTDIADVVALLGGQGTLNVNSWAPDSERLAYVAYPESSSAVLYR